MAWRALPRHDPQGEPFAVDEDFDPFAHAPGAGAGHEPERGGVFGDAADGHESRHGSAGDGPWPELDDLRRAQRGDQAPVRLDRAAAAGERVDRERRPALGDGCGDPRTSRRTGTRYPYVQVRAGEDVAGAPFVTSPEQLPFLGVFADEPDQAGAGGDAVLRRRPGSDVSRNTSSQRSLWIGRRSILPSSRTSARGSRCLEVAAAPADSNPATAPTTTKPATSRRRPAARLTCSLQLGFLPFWSSRPIAVPTLSRGAVEARPRAMKCEALLCTFIPPRRCSRELVG